MNALAFTVDDVLNVIEGNQCHLKMVLNRGAGGVNAQYYPLRAKYCKSRFKSKYVGSNEGDFGTVPRSFDDFWETCDRNIQKLVDEKGLVFKSFDIAVNDPMHGLSTVVDATGSIDGIDKAIFLLCFSGSWKKRYAIKLVAQYNMMVRAGIILHPTGYHLVALVLGKDAPVGKLYRDIQENDTLKKNGTIKTEGWTLLDGLFENGIVETGRVLKNVVGLDHGDIETNPVPINCATCRWHNTIIDDAGGVKKTCTGYYHAVR